MTRGTLRLEVLFGKVLRQFRMEHGLTQEELAGQCFTKSYISSLEHGRIRPSLEALFQLAENLGEPPSRLLAAVEAEIARQRPRGGSAPRHGSPEDPPPPPSSPTSPAP